MTTEQIADVLSAKQPEDLMTYPARPFSGGRLNRRPRLGTWAFEPKYNGWRAMIRTSDGAMFNRHNEPLTIAYQYRKTVAGLIGHRIQWLDCEVLGRRHASGIGSIIVLDAVIPKASYDVRRSILKHYFKTIPWYETMRPDSIGLVFSTTFEDDDKADEFDLWASLQEYNGMVGCEFYEGLVAKRTDSLYPIQLNSPDQPNTKWIKFRWD